MADVTTQRYSHLTECCIMSKDVLRSRSICTEHVFLAASIKKLLVTLKSRFMHVLRTQMGFSRFYRAHLKKMFQYIYLSPVSLDKHTVVDHHRDLYLRLYVLPFYKKRSSFSPSVSQQPVLSLTRTVMSHHPNQTLSILSSHVAVEYFPSLNEICLHS